MKDDRTTEEWVSQEALGLAAEIACHVRVMASELSDEDKASLLGLIMISIRNWRQDEHGLY